MGNHMKEWRPITADQFSLFNVIGDAIAKWSRLALDSLLDGLMFVDTDEQVLHANPAACAVFDYSGSEMAGQWVSSLFRRKGWAQSCYAFILGDISEEIAHTEEFRGVITAVEGTTDSFAIYERDGKLALGLVHTAGRLVPNPDADDFESLEPAIDVAYIERCRLADHWPLWSAA